MLFKRNPDQSQTISGSQITNAQVNQVQIGQADHDVVLTQSGNQGASQQLGMTGEEVVALLAQVLTTVSQAPLPDDEKTKALDYLKVAQQEAQADAPDKELIAKSLKRMGDSIKNASDTVEAGKSLWQTVKPMLLPLGGWLGKAAVILNL